METIIMGPSEGEVRFLYRAKGPARLGVRGSGPQGGGVPPEMGWGFNLTVWIVCSGYVVSTMRCRTYGSRSRFKMFL